MFINLKINTKVVLTILSILFIIIIFFTIFKIIKVKDENIINDPDLISMNTTNYTNILKEINMSIDTYVGHKITVNGFVYRNEDFKKDEFVVSRNMIICCESDPAIVGIMCKYKDADKFPNETWVKVEGIIEKYEYNDMTIPIINVSNIKKINTPKNRNVLPPTI